MNRSDCYEELRDYYRAALTTHCPAWRGAPQIQILEGLLRLRQAACHPGLIDRARVGETSAKIEALPSLGGDPRRGPQGPGSRSSRVSSIVRRRLDATGTAYAYSDGRTRTAPNQSSGSRRTRRAGCF